MEAKGAGGEDMCEVLSEATAGPATAIPFHPTKTGVRNPVLSHASALAESSAVRKPVPSVGGASYPRFDQEFVGSLRSLALQIRCGRCHT